MKLAAKQTILKRINGSLLLVLFILNTIVVPATSAQKTTINQKNDKKQSPLKSSRLYSRIKRERTLSANPVDSEITSFRGFEEPLYPLGNKKSTAQENAALAVALRNYRSQNDNYELAPLAKFLHDFPDSPWRSAIELNMGLLEYQQGFLTAAKDHWEFAWEHAKTDDSQPGQAIADRAIGELILLNSRLGRMDIVEHQLKEIDGRQLWGSTEDRVEGARQGMTFLKRHPELGFKCGPAAVRTVCSIVTKKSVPSEVVEKFPTTKDGANLAQLQKLAAELGCNYQAARREPGAPVIIPSVLHWKLEHFSAITSVDANKYYHVVDPTFERAGSYWVPQRAIDIESDGYFLVPAGPLPVGWKAVSNEEALKVWGKMLGHVRMEQQKTKWAPKIPKECQTGAGMAQPSAFSMQASLNIIDVPLSYTPRVGPRIDFELNYNDGETDLPSNSAFTSFSPNWTLNWVSWARPDASKNVIVHVRGGGVEKFWNTGTPSDPVFTPDFQSFATLEPIPAHNPTSYVRRLTDGSTEVFNLDDEAGNLLMTQAIDPQQNAVTMSYDNEDYRLLSITDASGKTSTFSYNGPSAYQPSAITDPFGRSCTFDYFQSAQNGPYRLVKITDVIGLSSEFVYAQTGFISALTTPYGTTFFQKMERPPSTDSQDGRTLRTIFPDGTSSLLVNYLKPYFQTAYWDREAIERYPHDPQNRDWSHSTNTVWLRANDGLLTLTPFFRSVKRPLESLVRYTYPNEQAGDEIDMDAHPLRTPLTVSRTVATGTQLYQYEYNQDGNVISAIDPLSRKLTFDYRPASADSSTRLDLEKIRETKGTNNHTLAKWHYPTESINHHSPDSFTDASGFTTTFQYTPKFQPHIITDPNSDTTTFNYSNDLLTSIDGPLPGTHDVTNFQYDLFDRINTITNSLGYQRTFEFDAMDRLRQVNYPDGSNEQIKYDRLDPVLLKDRSGRWTQRAFDNMQQLKFETDPAGRQTNYHWCSCGSPHMLIDPAGNTTTWERDIEGRIAQVKYADGSTVSLTYEPTSGNLSTRTDALGQVTTYSYNIDDTISGITYQNTVNPSQNSNVAVSYDPTFPRPVTISNGWGSITYQYNNYRIDGGPTVLGAGRLSTITNTVIPNSVIAFAYDNMGRTTGRSIDGSNNSVTCTYDAASRVLTQNSGGLGAFSIEYAGDTPSVLKGSPLVAEITYPTTDTTTANFLYSDVLRLSEIKNLTGASLLSQFNFQYNPAGEITQWRQQQNGTDTYSNFEYDKAGQLITAQQGGAVQPPFTNQLYYTYDLASNRTSESWITASTHLANQIAYNTLNQLLASGPGGQIRFKASTAKAIASAQISSSVVNINSDIAGITYSVSKSPSNSSTQITQATIADNALISIGGIPQADTNLTVTITNNSIPTSPISASYTVKPEDALDSIASGLARSINDNEALASSGVKASNTAIAELNDATVFSANPVLAPGTNSSAVSAIDGIPTSETKVYQTTIAGDSPKSFSHDANGNLLQDGSRSFSWDAENRLTKITYGNSGETTTFQYDPLGRCVRQIETGTVSDEKQIVWSGLDRAEERDASGAVLKKFYALGEVSSDSTKSFYFKDHLGSIREMTNDSGTIQAQYSYTPFGERTKIAGSGAEADFGFAGMYQHERTGLNLTLFRAYNSRGGRWLSRDPIGESEGVNLYAYVRNNPARFIDPLGLGPEQFLLNPTVLRLVALGLTIGNMAAGSYSGPGYAAVKSAAAGAMARTSAATGLEAGVLRFSQVTASSYFSQAGKFAGKTICEVASELRSGALSPAELPVEYISRGGANLIINTRSSLALQQAGVPLSEWNIVNRTGIAAAEAAMTSRLGANGLTNAGTNVIRITGIGRGASNLAP